jgi:hypothetical protein
LLFFFFTLASCEARAKVQKTKITKKREGQRLKTKIASSRHRRSFKKQKILLEEVAFLKSCGQRKTKNATFSQRSIAPASSSYFYSYFSLALCLQRKHFLFFNPCPLPPLRGGSRSFKKKFLFFFKKLRAKVQKNKITSSTRSTARENKQNHKNEGRARGRRAGGISDGGQR